MFVPQSYALGQEAQVDWFEASAKLGGEHCVLQFFAMRSMSSGDAFHRAYTNATQQAFLEGHEHGFAYFGGVFRTLRYDNLSSYHDLRRRDRSIANSLIERARVRGRVAAAVSYAAVVGPAAISFWSSSVANSKG